MNSCHRRRFVKWIVFAVPLAWASATVSVAQSLQREFPTAAVRGIVQIVAPPSVLLDGKPDRLSPGVRIRSPQNRLLMSGSLVGESMLVNFTRDSGGLIHEIWVLSPEEALQKRELATSPRNFQFSSEADKTLRDDGNTPFHMLPKFPQQ